MKNSFAIWFVLLLISLGCNKPYEVKSFYKNGKVKEIFTFENRKTSKLWLNYSASLFSEDGNLTGVTLVKDGIRKKDLYYYENGILMNVINYKHGKKHGVEKIYTKEGELSEEILYITGKHIVKMKAYSQGDNDYYYYYYIDNDSLENCGVLKYDKDNNVIPKYSFYCDIDCKDSINSGEKMNFLFKIFTFGKENRIDSIIIGDFNFDYKFIDNSKNIFIKEINQDFFKYTTTSYNMGDNLIMGKIYISSIPSSNDEKMGREFIFYKTFYVRCFPR